MTKKAKRTAQPRIKKARKSNITEIDAINEIHKDIARIEQKIEAIYDVLTIPGVVSTKQPAPPLAPRGTAGELATTPPFLGPNRDPARSP